MDYIKMKEIDIFSISSSSKEIEQELIKNILESDINDILKYINYLRYIQLNTDDFKLMRKIVNFLFTKELSDLEREHNDYNYGETEELELISKTESIKNEKNIVVVNNISYICVAQFKDDFENIFIVKNDANEYKKFGAIKKEDSNLVKYIYELHSEHDDYFKELEKVEIGFKANIISKENKINAIKTYIKENIDVDDYKFLNSRKNDKNEIVSNIISGSYLIIKKDNILEYDINSLIENID